MTLVCYTQAEASYRHFFGLHDDIVVTLMAAYNFRVAPTEAIPTIKRGKLLKLSNVEFNIFPVLFKFYDNNPVGKAVLKNTGDTKISNLKLTLFVKQYMDDPKECVTLPELAAGSEVDHFLG